MGETDHRDADREIPVNLVCDREGVFAGKRDREVRHNAEHRNPGEILDDPDPAFKDSRIAPEFIDNDAPDEWPNRFRQQFQGTIDLGKYTTSLNICHEDQGNFEGLCKQGICDITVIQIDLGCSPGTFGNNLAVSCISRPNAATASERRKGVSA